MYPINNVSVRTPALDAHAPIASKVVAQSGPSVPRDGNATVSPMRAAAESPPVRNGYSGAIRTRPLGKAHASSPCAIAHVEMSDSCASLGVAPPRSCTMATNTAVDASQPATHHQFERGLSSHDFSVAAGSMSWTSWDCAMRPRLESRRRRTRCNQAGPREL